jgi:hypothetical protein
LSSQQDKQDDSETPYINVRAGIVLSRDNFRGSIVGTSATSLEELAISERIG